MSLSEPDLTATAAQVKLFDTPLVCPTSGCESVLSSAYSSLFGVPLSLLGFFAYAAVAGVALAANAAGGKDSQEARTMDTMLLGGATLLATCSASLM